MDIEMVRDGEFLYLVVDGERELQGKDGVWRAREANEWTVQQVQLWGKNQIWEATEFSFEGEALDTVFYIDVDGEPHPVEVSNAIRKMGTA